MSKKTLALIVSLVLLTVALLAIALSTKQPATPGTEQKEGEPTATPTPPAHTILNLTPSTLNAVAGTNQVQVQMNTEDNQVTAVQLEIAYDPKAVSNVRVTQGTFFTNPVVLLNINDTTTGRVSYALGIAPAQDPVNGTGTVATISFTPNPAATMTQTEIQLLPKSLVTARGITASVLKEATGTTIMLPARGTAPVQTTAPTTPATSPQPAQ